MKYLLPLLFCLAGCSTGNPAPGTPQCASHEVDLVYAADSTFTNSERASLTAAATDWNNFSNHRINITIGYSSDSAGFAIHRLTSDDPKTIARDKLEGTKYNEPDYRILGWYDHSADTIYLVVDRVSPDDLRQLSIHELGHTAGLTWPDCENEPRAPIRMIDGKMTHDCDHVSDPTAVMYPYFQTGRMLGSSDKEFCRANCLCE